MNDLSDTFEPAGREDSTGRFLPGNDFWKARSSAGRNPTFTRPDQLEAACHEYFGWNDDHPLYETKLVTHQGHVTQVAVPKPRAMTLAGLCNFLSIARSTWNEWRASRPDLSEVIERVEQVIWQQKYEGAAANLFNSNIIARELGLSEKNEITGQDGAPIKVEPVSRLEIARRVAQLLEAGMLEKEAADDLGHER